MALVPNARQQMMEMEGLRSSEKVMGCRQSMFNAHLGEFFSNFMYAPCCWHTYTRYSPTCLSCALRPAPKKAQPPAHCVPSLGSEGYDQQAGDLPAYHLVQQTRHRRPHSMRFQRVSPCPSTYVLLLLCKNTHWESGSFFGELLASLPHA